MEHDELLNNIIDPLCGHAQYKASLNRHFMGVSCTLNRVTHQQIWSFCMKRGGERGETFHPHDTSELRFQVVGNRVKPALRRKISSD